MTALLKPSKAQTVQEAAMKRALTVIVLLVLAAGSFLVIPEQVSAGSSTDAALALGAFAVLNQIARGETIFNGPPPTSSVRRSLLSSPSSCSSPQLFTRRLRPLSCTHQHRRRQWCTRRRQ